MTIYKQHVFICVNQKDNDKQCCANSGALEVTAYAKQRAKELGLTKSTGFRISSSGCLGQCALGPVLVVYPEGAWYTYKSKEDVENLLKALAEGVLPTENRVDN